VNKTITFRIRQSGKTAMNLSEFMLAPPPMQLPLQSGGSLLEYGVSDEMAEENPSLHDRRFDHRGN